MQTIILKKHKEESILRMHPWVFSGAIAVLPNQLQEGELVCVEDSNHNKLGVGHYQIGSIAVRILSFFTDKLPTDFWFNRINAAWQVRQKLNLLNEHNDTFRLVHGEGDFLPGLIVDIYSNTAVMQAHSVGMHLEREQIAKAILRVLPQVKNVYYKSENTLPYKAYIESKSDGFLIYNNPILEDKPFFATENGLQFAIDWFRGQKTGFFVDQRENRSLLEYYSKGKNVLNMFCYTGGFSVYALRGGAKKVVSVDSSQKAIDLVRINIEKNFPLATNHEEHSEDAFRFLDNLSNDMEDSFDLIILDPPAFAKHRGAIKNALQGYQRLNRKAFEKIPKGGILFTFSCSQAIDKEMFRLAVFSAAAQSGRKVRILHQLTQPQDHPINIYHPEGEYLKGLVLYVE